MGGLWGLLEGFWTVFGAMLRPCWRPWGRFWGLWEPLGAILEALAGVSEAPEAILRCFGRVSESSEAILQVSRGFHSVFTGFHLCYKFTKVFTVFSPRWRAKRAPLASEASPVGERSELRWRAKRAPCGLLSLAPSLLHLQLLAWDALKIRTAWLTCPYSLFLSPLKWFRYYVYVLTLMQSHCTLCIAL